MISPREMTAPSSVHRNKSNSSSTHTAASKKNIKSNSRSGTAPQHSLTSGVGEPPPVAPPKQAHFSSTAATTLFTANSDGNCLYNPNSAFSTLRKGDKNTTGSTTEHTATQLQSDPFHNIIPSNCNNSGGTTVVTGAGRDSKSGGAVPGPYHKPTCLPKFRDPQTCVWTASHAANCPSEDRSSSLVNVLLQPLRPILIQTRNHLLSSKIIRR